MTFQSVKLYPFLFLAGITAGIFLPPAASEPDSAITSTKMYTAEDALYDVLGTNAELVPAQEKINTARHAAVATLDSAPLARGYLEDLVALGRTFTPSEHTLTDEEKIVYFYKAEYVKQQLKDAPFHYANFFSVYLEDSFTGRTDGFTEADYETYIADYLSLMGKERK